MSNSLANSVNSSPVCLNLNIKKFSFSQDEYSSADEYKAPSSLAKLALRESYSSDSEHSTASTPVFKPKHKRSISMASPKLAPFRVDEEEASEESSVSSSAFFKTPSTPSPESISSSLSDASRLKASKTPRAGDVDHQKEIDLGWRLLLRKCSKLRGNEKGYVPVDRIRVELKNRFTKFLIREDTRVKLRKGPNTSEDEDKEHCDYINASWISDYVKDSGFQRYIATQAPIKSTVKDFWCLMEQEEVELVVMLTRTSEDGLIPGAMENHFTQSIRSNSSRTSESYVIEPYWPKRDEEYKVHANLYVRALKEVNIDKNVVYREFQLVDDNVNPSKETRLKLLQYKGWPDQKIPLDMADFDKFFSEYRNIREMCSKDRPIVVHCSAGVGRTGSFIAIDMLIDRMQNAVIKEGRLSVEPSSYLPDIVYVIRKQRNENMVQSKDQFAFIYEFVTSYQDQFVSMKKGRISIGKCTPAISRNGSRSALSTVLSSDEEMESLPRIAEKSIVQFDEESKDA